MTLSGDYEPSPTQWVRDQVELYESSGGTEGTTLRELPVVIVTNLGVASGKVRKTPLMRVEHDGVYCAVGSVGGGPKDPAWVANLEAHPEVELQDGPARGPRVVRKVVGVERDLWWDRAVAAFPDYAEYARKTERVIPVFVLEPVTA